MPRGPAPKPIEQKRRAGNPGKRGLPEGLPAVAPIPAELERLEPAAAMDAVLAEGVHWIGATDAPAVAMLRQLLERLDRAWAEDDWRQAVEVQKRAAALLGELGFTPAARSRLGLAEVKAASVLERIKRERAAKN